MKDGETAPKAHKRVVKAKYTSHACNQCRKSKTRCDGKEPICARCERMGHECNWGAEDARKAITRHHEQSLRNRIKVLETHISNLEAQLAAQGHTPRALSTSASNDDDAAGDSGDGAMHQEDSDQEHSDPNEPADGEVDALVAPTKNLYLENDEIHLYGLTSVFRLANQHEQRRGTTPLRQTGPSAPTQENTQVNTNEQLNEGLSTVPPMDLTTDTRKHVLLIPKKRANGTVKTPKPHCSCWSNCWSRYLPPHHEVPMEREEHDRLLDIFFRLFNHWSMRVIPSLFLRDMFRVLHTPFKLRRPRGQIPVSGHVFTTRTAHYSPLLHNSIMAVATVFSNPRPVVEINLINPANLNSNNSSASKTPTAVSSTQLARHRARIFAAHSKSFIEPECEQPSISALLGLGLLASYHTGESQQSLGFMYCGMSFRLSHALGLRCDCSEWVKRGLITAQDQFDRNWCFHVMCQQDAVWSLYVGREFGTPTPKPGQNMPTGWKELGLDLENWEDEMSDDEDDDDDSVGLPREKEKKESTHIFATFLASCDLLRLCRRILDVVYVLSDKAQAHTAHLIATEVDIQLTAWKDGLQPELKLTPSTQNTAPPHKLMLHLAYWWLLILLHRPFYRKRQSGCSTIGETFSVTRCNQAAKEIVSLLRSHRAQYTLRYVPITLIQTCFAAGTIYLLSAIHADKSLGMRPAPVTRSAALTALEELVDMLVEIGQSWDCAKQFSDIFRYFLTLQNRPGAGAGDAVEGEREGELSSVKEISDRQQSNQLGAPNPGGVVDVWPLPRDITIGGDDRASSIAVRGGMNGNTPFGILPTSAAGAFSQPRAPAAFNDSSPIYPSDGAWGFFNGDHPQAPTETRFNPFSPMASQPQLNSLTASTSLNQNQIQPTLAPSFFHPADTRDSFQMLTDNDVVTKYHNGMSLDMMDMMMVDGGSTALNLSSTYKNQPGLSLGPHTYISSQEMLPQGMQWSNEDLALFNMLTQQPPR